MNDEEYVTQHGLVRCNLGDGHVAICCLWHDLHTHPLSEIYESRNVAVVGNLFTLRGITPLMLGLLRWPQITNLIVWGPDTQHTGDALAEVWSGRLISGLEASLQTAVTSSVILTDARGRGTSAGRRVPRTRAELLHLAEGSLPTGSLVARREPIELQMPEIVVGDTRPSNVTGWSVDTKTVELAWQETLANVMTFGVVKSSEHIEPQREILNVMTTIRPERASLLKIGERLGLTNLQVAGYLDQMTNPTLPDGLAYTPGYRLGAHFGIDQLQNLVDKLNGTPHTRRAVASLWDPIMDPHRQSPPCITQITVNITNGQLYLTYDARSQDIFGAMPMDTLGMIHLQRELAAQLELQPGPLTARVVSAHVYERDWERALTVIRDSAYRRLAWMADPRGNVIIIVRDGQIVVTLVNPAGDRAIWMRDGQSGESLMNAMLIEGVITRADHVAYISRELTLAETCLRNNTSYRQDAVSHV